MRRAPKGVFINCPFDSVYQPIFNAIVFAIYDLGFVAGCSLEVDDASEIRLNKIMRIIGQCAYGIHDISSVSLSGGIKLPRFNMPLELGLFLGCKQFGGGAQRKKAVLILDSKPYRYRASISDIAGQDIHVHGDKPRKAITEVRDWLTSASKVKGLPGGSEIASRYVRFGKDLPAICKQLKRKVAALTFTDFSEIVEIWLKGAR